MSKRQERWVNGISQEITSGLFSIGQGNDTGNAYQSDQAAKNRAAYENWKNQDSAKWHEWHAKDQAKKGHAAGAAYHSNQANYYRNK